jgi:transposase
LVRLLEDLNTTRQAEINRLKSGIRSADVVRILEEHLAYLDSFQDAKQVVAYAGLNPRQRLSGKLKGRSPISKTGNPQLRKALYFPAMTAKKRNPVVHQFCVRLEDNGLLPMQVIIAGMRKLLHIAFGVLKNDCPFDPNYEQSPSQSQQNAAFPS